MYRMFGFLLLGALLHGCSARRRAEDTLVRKITFEGTKNTPFSPHTKSALKAQMTQQESGRGVLGPLSFVIAPELLDHTLLDWDEQPIEVYLAHQGWFDADLVRWELQQRRKARRAKVAAVDVVGHIVLGEPTVWDAASPELRWDGPPLLPEDVLKKLLLLRPGRRVQLYDVVSAEEDLTRLLVEQGHALAQVHGEVQLDPTTHTANVVLTLQPGSSYTVGPAVIEGDSTVASDRLLDVVDLPVGEAWTASLMDEARDRLYGLGAFRQVHVGPGVPGEGTALPVRIQVVDGRPRKIAITGSLGFEGPFFVPRAAVTTSHDNLGGRLQRVDLGASIGAGTTLLGGFIPLYSLRAGLHSKRFFGRPVDGSVEVKGSNNLFEGVIPRRQAEIGSSWRARWGHLSTRSSPGDEGPPRVGSPVDRFNG